MVIEGTVDQVEVVMEKEVRVRVVFQNPGVQGRSFVSFWVPRESAGQYALDKRMRITVEEVAS